MLSASQGQTIRAGVTIDCDGNEPRGTSDDEWWLNLYVMFSRVTRMADMLLLRPPPRQLLEPASTYVCMYVCMYVAMLSSAEIEQLN